MAGYTIVPVADVPDQAAEVGMDPDHFEIRFMRGPLGLQNFSVTYEVFAGDDDAVFVTIAGPQAGFDDVEFIQDYSAD